MTATIVRNAGWVALASLVGCGGNTTEIPDELLDAIENSGSGNAGAYPAGPYGTEVGQTAENLCFDEGWRNPTAAEFDPDRFESICLADFHDPAGGGTELILVNAAAVWCAACKTEYGGTSSRPSLAEHLDERRADGFMILGTLFQKQNGDPADSTDAAVWTETYDVDFPFALDPDFKIGAFTAAADAPYNMLIDARTMEIVLSVKGDQPAVIFTEIDGFLADRAAGAR